MAIRRCATESHAMVVLRRVAVALATALSLYAVHNRLNAVVNPIDTLVAGGLSAVAVEGTVVVER